MSFIYEDDFFVYKENFEFHYFLFDYNNLDKYGNLLYLFKKLVKLQIEEYDLLMSDFSEEFSKIFNLRFD